MGKTTSAPAGDTQGAEAPDINAAIDPEYARLEALLIELGHELPEGTSLIVQAGDLITRLTGELGDALTTIAEYRNGQDANGQVAADLGTQIAKIAAAIVALGYEPQPYSDEYSPADHIIGLLSEAKDKVGELESKLGAATAKVETLEGKLDKLANPKAPKKKRAVMLALADKAPTALEAALTGATSLVFSEEGGQIDDIKPIELSPADFRKDGSRALLTRRIEIDREAAFVRIDHAWLIADGKPVAKCEIPGGLPAGNGRAAMFDSGHLIFG